jgi:two-component system, NtrC family, C4-dicarboxylate transport sensor histidine kinase DctB
LEAMEGRAGEKRLTVAATARDAMAVFEVRDTGGGIPPEIQGQLFDPFFTTKASGGGMGLSILQAIVLRHGGFVTVASGSDGGAVFTVTLPLRGPNDNLEVSP